MLLGDLAGQDHAAALLLRAVETRRLAHAYLFDGPPGVGKRSAAVGVGLALACPRSSGRGCGACDVCRRILAGNHPDVRTIAAATAQILIEQAQEIVLLAATRPHEAPARVLVIDEADRLNPNAANCLLKTLEEPTPANHIVLVTAAPDRLLPTIRSRTQRVRFVPVAPPTLVEIAVRRGADRARAETAAALAGGSVARLLDLAAGSDEAQAESDALWQTVSDWRRAAAGRAVGPIFDAASGYGDKESKAGLPEIVALLGRFYRDTLALASGAPDLILLRERAPEMERLAQAAARAHPDLVPLRRALAAVLEADAALAANVNPALTIERLLLEMRACERGAAA